MLLNFPEKQNPLSLESHNTMKWKMYVTDEQKQYLIMSPILFTLLNHLKN